MKNLYTPLIVLLIGLLTAEIQAQKVLTAARVKISR